MSAPADIDDLAMLAEFAELAMARARAAAKRAEAVEAEGGDPQGHLVAFDRMGRAMRLALSLRRRLAGEAQVQAGRRVQARKEHLRAALAPAIRLHAPFADRQALDWALAHRLETEADTLASLSFEAGVARLSRMLGLPAEAPPPQGTGDRVAVDGAPAETPGASTPSVGGVYPRAGLQPAPGADSSPCGGASDGLSRPSGFLAPEVIDRTRQMAARATRPP